MLISLLKKYAGPGGVSDSDKESCYTVVMDTLAILLERMPENANIFRSSCAIRVHPFGLMFAPVVPFRCSQHS